jgi:DNA ligase-1
MPKHVALDGELFTKRGDFQRVMGMVRKTVPVDSEWRQIKFMAFDVVTLNVPFERRYDALKRIVRQTASPHLVLVENRIVTSRAQLESLHRQITAKGGEGLMLRVPGSLYEGKRTSNLLKLKRDEDDEAIVVGHEFGQGKNANQMGKLVVRWKHTRSVFHVGSGFTDRQRRDYRRLFPINTIIRVKYNGMTNSNKPRFPIFMGVRDRMDL